MTWMNFFKLKQTARVISCSNDAADVSEIVNEITFGIDAGRRSRTADPLIHRRTMH